MENMISEERGGNVSIAKGKKDVYEENLFLWITWVKCGVRKDTRSQKSHLERGINGSMCYVSSGGGEG